MKNSLPNYDISLLSFINSIHKYFLGNSYHNTLKEVDEILENNKYKNVVVLLCDGMGSNIVNKHLKDEGLFRQNKLMDIYSTFPSTTVAATTCVRCAKSPIETSWLGWHQYYKEIDLDLCTFTGQGYYQKDIKIIPNPSEKQFPIKSIAEEFNENGINAIEIFPSFKKDFENARNFKTLLRKTNYFIKKGIQKGFSKNFVYAYWDEPDHSIHGKGVGANKINRIVNRIEHNVNKLFKKVSNDTIIFIIADHGLVDVEHINIADYPDFLDTLERLPSLESRNSTFFVKNDKHNEFEELFNKYFSKDFILFSKEEAIEKQLFGPGIPTQKSMEFIGDYVAPSISNKCLSYLTGKNTPMKAAHAGITVDEMLVPLIVLKKD